MVKRKAVKQEHAVESLIYDLRPLIKELSKARKQAQKLGVFVDDRELLVCSACGLIEDVACDGRLLVYRAGRPPKDSGLRFIESSNGAYRCPSCGVTV